ncbi:hypothetical protein MC885_009415 [Smutsia gigantea]|nr:hypothetical protein MC885_009415 [Smutsia gigantea]
MTFQPPAPGLGRRFLRSPRAASLRRPARPRSSPDRRSCEAAALTCQRAGPAPPRPALAARLAVQGSAAPGSLPPRLPSSWVEAAATSAPGARGRERGGSAPTRREGRGRAPAEQRGRSSRRVASRSAGGKGRVFPEVAEAAIVGKSRASGAQRDKIFCTPPLRPWEPLQHCSERRGWGHRCSLAEDAARPGRKNALSQRK